MRKMICTSSRNIRVLRTCPNGEENHWQYPRNCIKCKKTNYGIFLRLRLPLGLLVPDESIEGRISRCPVANLPWGALASNWWWEFMFTACSFMPKASISKDLASSANWANWFSGEKTKKGCQLCNLHTKLLRKDQWDYPNFIFLRLGLECIDCRA